MKAEMLTDQQTDQVWEKKLHAEIRAYYFADLASRDTTKKQVVTGSSFLLSSAAAATLAAKVPDLWPLVMAVASALLAAYSIAVGLDKRMALMAKLHYTWNSLASDYERLWNHWFDEDAEQQFAELLRRGREASEIAVTEAPNNESLIAKWTDSVYALYAEQKKA